MVAKEEVEKFIGKDCFLKLRYKDQILKVKITKVDDSSFSFLKYPDCKLYLESLDNIESLREWIGSGE